MPLDSRSVIAPGSTKSTLLLGKHILIVMLSALLVSWTTGCAKKMAPSPPPPPPTLIGGDDSLSESLFKGDQAVLSNQDIDRILTAKISMSDRHRLAVLHLNTRNMWVQPVADIEAENTERFMHALAAAPQLTQVRFLPTLLVPERRTVPYLREAAARFQADLLLVYGTGVRSFQRDRLIGTDEVRAESVVESVLLDVRTGIVVHAAQASERISVKRTSGDLNFSETIAKARAEASGKALVKMAGAVVSFVSAEQKTAAP